MEILVPSLLLSVFMGSLNGYALSFWKVKLLTQLLASNLPGLFYPVMIYPLVRMFASINIDPSSFEHYPWISFLACPS